MSTIFSILLPVGVLYSGHVVYHPLSKYQPVMIDLWAPKILVSRVGGCEGCHLWHLEVPSRCFLCRGSLGDEQALQVHVRYARVCAEEARSSVTDVSTRREREGRGVGGGGNLTKTEYTTKGSNVEHLELSFLFFFSC